MIFDNVFLEGTINVTRHHKAPTMKDFIVCSNEYIIGYQDMLTDLLASFHAPTPTGNPAQSPQLVMVQGIELAGAGALDENLAPMVTASVYMTLHLFNQTIHQFEDLHDQIARDRQNNSAKPLREISLEFLDRKRDLASLHLQKKTE